MDVDLDTAIDTCRNSVIAIADRLSFMLSSQTFADDYLIYAKDWLLENHCHVKELIELIREEDDVDWTYTERCGWLLSDTRGLYAACMDLLERPAFD